MSTPSMPANDDPKAAPANRALRAIVIILGVMIVLAFVALIWGLISSFSGHHAGDASRAADYMLPQGSKILQIQTTTTGRIVMAVQTPEGSEVDIFDADSGKLIVRIRPSK